MSERRYYWLKLHENFFRQKSVTFLRRKPNGDTLVIAYLEMMLATLESGGKLTYSFFEPTIEEEIAYQINEPLEVVKEVLKLLTAHHLAERVENDENGPTIYLKEAITAMGTEGSSAKRVRELRKKRQTDCGTTDTDYFEK